MLRTLGIVHGRPSEPMHGDTEVRVLFQVVVEVFVDVVGQVVVEEAVQVNVEVVVDMVGKVVVDAVVDQVALIVGRAAANKDVIDKSVKGIALSIVMHVVLLTAFGVDNHVVGLVCLLLS